MERHIFNIENPPLAVRIARGFKFEPQGPLIVVFEKREDEAEESFVKRVADGICAHYKRFSRHALN